MATVLTDSAIKTIADAIFKERPTAVIETYSSFGQEPREFHSSEDVFTYANALRNAGDNPHLIVHYPDMAGRVVRSRIELNPSKCGGHTYRYEAVGWGLIFVYLQLSPAGRIDSFISANSEKRALAWAPTYPDMDPPSTWNWPAVARHLRRLRRALKLAA